MNCGSNQLFIPPIVPIRPSALKEMTSILNKREEIRPYSPLAQVAERLEQEYDCFHGYSEGRVIIRF